MVLAHMVAAAHFPGTDVVEQFRVAGARAGALPAIIQCAHGTEFTSVALVHCAYWDKAQLDFSRPVDNCVCAAFNGSVRRECLSQHLFADLRQAQQVIDDWRQDYNNVRAQGSLGQ